MALSLTIGPARQTNILLGRIEMGSVILCLAFRYGVIFLDSFFLSIINFIGFSLCFLVYAVAANVSLVRLFAGIMYLGGMMVLFSYSFILSDVKVRFRATPVNLVVLGVLFVALGWERCGISVATDVIEVYRSRFSTLIVRSVLLYSVLGVCLGMCLGAYTVGHHEGTNHFFCSFLKICSFELQERIVFSEELVGVSDKWVALIGLICGNPPPIRNIVKVLFIRVLQVYVTELLMLTQHLELINYLL